MKQISSRHIMMLAIIPLLFCAQSAFGMLPSKLAPLIGLAAKKGAQAARVGLKPLTVKNPVTAAAMRNIMTSQMPQAQCSRCAVPISPISHLGTMNYLSNVSRLAPSQILKLVHEQRRNFSSGEKDETPILAKILMLSLCPLIIAFLATAIWLGIWAILVMLDGVKPILESTYDSAAQHLPWTGKYKEAQEKKAKKVAEQEREAKWQIKLDAKKKHEAEEKAAEQAALEQFKKDHPDLIELAELLRKIQRVAGRLSEMTDEKSKLHNSIVTIELNSLEAQFVQKFDVVLKKIAEQMPQEPGKQIAFLQKWQNDLFKGFMSIIDELRHGVQFYGKPEDFKRDIWNVYKQLIEKRRAIEQKIKQDEYAADVKRLQSELAQKQKEAEAKKQQQADTVKIAGAATAAIKFS